LSFYPENLETSYTGDLGFALVCCTRKKKARLPINILQLHIRFEEGVDGRAPCLLETFWK